MRANVSAVGWALLSSNRHSTLALCRSLPATPSRHACVESAIPFHPRPTPSRRCTSGYFGKLLFSGMFVCGLDNWLVSGFDVLRQGLALCSSIRLQTRCNPPAPASPVLGLPACAVPRPTLFSFVLFFWLLHPNSGEGGVANNSACRQQRPDPTSPLPLPPAPRTGDVHPPPVPHPHAHPGSAAAWLSFLTFSRVAWEGTS